MKSQHLVMVASLLIALIAGCYGAITGRVVDAETGQPIEGAVVLVEWTKTKGIGFTHTEVIRKDERLTDRGGEFNISGVFSLSVNEPIIVIYKKGYVAWRNDYRFPELVKREEFQWGNRQVFKLEHFKKVYSHSRHSSFLSSGGLNLESTELERVFSWELPLAQKEDELYNKKVKTLQAGTNAGRDIWDEVVKELYLLKGGNHAQ